MAKNPLKELREKLKISGLQMAMLLNLNANYYYGLESGSYHLTKRILGMLKEKFNIDIDEFLKQFEEWRLEREKELLKELRKGLKSD